MDNNKLYKYKIILIDGSVTYVHGLDEDDAVAVFALSGGDVEQIEEVIPWHNQKRHSRTYDDE